MNSRIYEVTDSSTGVSRLVDAVSASAAIRHVATPMFSVAVADVRSVARLSSAGVKIEVAKSLKAAGEAK